ncbi:MULTISPECIES: M3 family metallopeptidase [unclassified Cellulophaga]|uniref:M3 family metallopeptidase n=1 Tax=unclassified Cellulophaga TaxID=2634405 RepID=UPI0026E23C3C|nr:MULTISPECIES: M3 family metallopeptidase [unclassified Cellulophaga]MDO6492479.1 M3 family metallopeptidase [Cellulophaga sp. 2_MG-2023]MDO6493581.1 M3 family metallopeptidase [Cellulophaga sp. 3_MG-2023]
MKNIYTVALVIILFASCKDSKTKDETTKPEAMSTKDNPLLVESKLPYGAPDFTLIKNEHFKPALQQGIAAQNKAVAKIANNTEPATFDNTILELEKSGTLLQNVQNIFSGLTGAHTNDELQAVQEEMAPKFSELQDGIYLNENLFERVKELYVKRDSLVLDPESYKLLETYFEAFEKAGANLSFEDKETLKKYNTKLATLINSFNKTLLSANNNGAIVFTNKEDLAGLTESQLKSLENKDGEGWKIPLLNTTQQPLLQSLESRAAREKIFKAAFNRADGTKNDTKDIILQIANLRAKKGALLGFTNYAEWSLQGTMAEKPENVFKMFNGLIPAATTKAKNEAEEIQKMITKNGEDFTLAAWDWNRYAEMVKKEKYDLDENAIKPYFEIKTVLEKGVFYAAEKLYGITFKERKDIPTYHKDVMVYELFEENGDKLGLFYADYFARPSKRGGAWMSNFVTQSHLYNKKPVIYNVCNYPKPAEGDAALITYDEVSTMFHEFGHALHGFFANQEYPSLSGTAVARDFVEFPSQFNENWALYPEILKNYALHYKTGEQIPQALIDKIKKAGTFNQGYSLTENLAASNLDMQWHTIAADANVSSANAFEKDALHKTKLDVVSAVPPRYRSTYFAHIFGSGYAAGYYSYLWTEMLHHDAYNWFENNGGLTRENGQRFRDMVLSRGNTVDLEAMYKNWRGSDPKIEPMLKARGLK